MLHGPELIKGPNVNRPILIMGFIFIDVWFHTYADSAAMAPPARFSNAASPAVWSKKLRKFDS